MKQFMGGFIVASVLWAGVLVAQSFGMIDLFDPANSRDAEMQADVAEIEISPSDEPRKKRRGKGKWAKRKRARRHKQQATGQPRGTEYDMSEGVKGDVLGTPGSRDLAMDGAEKEDQLSPSEIDKGIDRVFKGIERCLVLLPSDAPAQGKVVLGMEIASSGQVTKVNLKGPNTMIGGQTGACFRRKVKSIRYRSFDGPDMIAHYPIVFE